MAWTHNAFLTGLLEIHVHETWVKVDEWIFRSWGGPRRLNGEVYNGATFYLGTDRVADDEAKMCDIARGNIERHLGDVADGDTSEDALFDEALTLAFDALHDAGYPNDICRRIAESEAQKIAQP